VTAIAKHTAVGGSGRVGRTEAGRALKENALTAAVIAAVRHNHTEYDELLATWSGSNDGPAARRRQNRRDSGVMAKLAPGAILGLRSYNACADEIEQEKP
jgi:hypothetical protein